MITVKGLSIEFSTRPLFKNATFVVDKGDRIALVGRNGAGKSTLLKMLAGQQQPTSGSITVSNDCTIGYLPQVLKVADDTTVRCEARKAFERQIQLRERLKAMNHTLNERTDYDNPEYISLIEQFTQAHDYYMMMGGDEYDALLERTLVGLGFRHEDLERPTKEFSGGWRMRIELAKLLLQKPDVLLLDEPTNHLDIDSIQWLERFLATSKAAVVLVSHDRAFINNITNRTIEISCGQLIDYKVKYNEYLELRKERREQQKRAYINQQKEIEETRTFIECFRYQATKAVQVQQRIRQLEKIIPIEIDEVDTSAMHLKFPPCTRSGDFPLICDAVSKSYGQHKVFDNVNITIRRGEKVAFVGRNGEGKTTLVKCLMNEIPYTGVLKIGHNVQVGYFAQNQAQLLDESLTVYETIDKVATGDVRLRINDLLGAFMFGGEEAEKKVRVLSGGERSRLAMIKLLLQPVNMLVLDEPTNHLDMASKDVLKEALLAFDGTAIIVSHDREFLDGLVTKVYEFSNGAVKEHLGGIYDFLQTYNKGVPDDLSRLFIRKQTQDEPVKDVAQNSGKQAYQERKEQQKIIKKTERAVTDCENKIADMERCLQQISSQLNTPEKASDVNLIKEYTELKNKIEMETERWTELSIELDNLKQQYGL